MTYFNRQYSKSYFALCNISALKFRSNYYRYLVLILRENMQLIWAGQERMFLSPVEIIFKKKPDGRIEGCRFYISLPRTHFWDPLRTPFISKIIFWNSGLPSDVVTVDGKTWPYGMSYGEPRVSDPLLALCRVREDPKVVILFYFMLFPFTSFLRNVCYQFFHVIVLIKFFIFAFSSLTH